MKSVMTHNFAQVPRADIPRSAFNRSHGLKTTFDAGYLVPIFLDEALPGDTFNMQMASFARLATPIVPFMDNLFMDTFFFAVPYRLVWDNWQKFNGEQVDPGDSTDYLIPTLDSPPSGWDIQSLGDYFGLPPLIPITSTYNPVSALPFRAYNLCFNEWFRDENLQDSVPVPRGDGPDDPDDYVLLRRGKRHDYFTSALPWPQKGPSVTLPLGTSAPVRGNGQFTKGHTTSDATERNIVVNATTDALELNGYTGALNGFIFSGTAADVGLVADLSTATSATINALRQSFQIQKLYERDARGGTRYTEIIRSHFGVVSPDARLQRPEYLGGGSSPINVHPVQQTSATDSTSPQGNLAAFATASASGHGFTKSFTEHCLIIGLVSVRADLTYQQGINRMWSRRTRFDFYWPALSHLGEQSVNRREIFVTNTVNDTAAWGYQERYAEYRYKPSLVCGKFRSTAPQSLDIWHLAQDFEEPPTLNSTFIQDNPPVDRVIATPEEPHMLFDSYFSYKCTRPMPTYSVPGLVDHF
ncbi:major capsid protein [Flyfo microvirus Tbat2_160]|nr:major capsid protein [Flyfo microvirus Tbat2_160]